MAFSRLTADQTQTGMTAMGSTLVKEKTTSITQAIHSIFKSVEVLEGDCRQLILHHGHTAPHDLHTGEFQIYAAVYINGEQEQLPRVEGLVVLATRTPDAFSYKFISEDLNPHARECPICVLDFLTPTKQPWALSWRTECRNFQLNHHPLLRMAI
ncbi:hypothetical protein [Pseudovibrio sp. Tun.PSC04-5.I4]|uniref:hypothetical protein n=1 Tax=Pseudovibrio sp. Tun.PSC04-5.I4 TaxID=1798213 RepID=UPI00088DD013|nr:hypothetical protein [Pseudovibrio sp. Tun.PSC04-5.I4]SDQ36535.1 hypothetical protein SAMN04515695_0983 [Pseudovibrio sp. Tun.PSC04-5.I4]